MYYGYKFWGGAFHFVFGSKCKRNRLKWLLISFIVWSQMTVASVRNAAHGSNISGTVTSAFRSMGKTLINQLGNCGQQCTFDDFGACGLVWCVRKYRETALPQVTECQNRTWSDHQQEQCISNYIERYKKDPTLDELVKYVRDFNLL